MNWTPAVPAATRLAVYSNAYRIRLAEALAANVPQLQQLLGAEEFGAVASRYIDEHPSQFASIRWFGDRLAQELERSHAAQPWLAELARWEWALAASFDAQDATAVGIEALAAVAPDDWGELRLEFHPSVQHLELKNERAGAVQGAVRGTTGAATRDPRAPAAVVAVAAGPQDAVPLAGARRDGCARGNTQPAGLSARCARRCASGTRPKKCRCWPQGCSSDGSLSNFSQSGLTALAAVSTGIGMKLYTFFRSSAAFRVRIALNLKGLQV